MPSGSDPDLNLPLPSPSDVLAVLGSESDMVGLRAALRDLGLGVDVVRSRGEALTRFFAMGGHNALLLGPGLAPGMAWSLAAAIRDMDASIPVVAFGEHLARSPQHLADALLVAGHHPDSRAGGMAVMRALGLTPPQPDLI